MPSPRSAHPRRALVVGPGLAVILRAAGVAVTLLEHAPGVVHLPTLIERSKLEPEQFDFFAQEESLGGRLYLKDVHTLPCPTVFWSIDTHLNLYWQRYYGRLFDRVLTPHYSIIANLPNAWRLSAARLPTAGMNRPFVPHAERAYPLSFVGRLTSHRPLRAALVDLLREHHGLEARQDMSYSQMMDLYAQTRCIPNESIAFEVNFRLLEGASCGACMLTPDVGQDQDTLLTPETEMRVYADGHDLLEQLDLVLTRPTLAEKIGRAAWERVQAEHLPAHRGAQFLEHLPDTRTRALGADADVAFWLTMLQLHRNRLLPPEWPFLTEASARLPENEETLAGRLRFYAEHGLHEEVDALCARLLVSGGFAESFLVNMGAASAALFRNRLDKAKQFWYRQHKHSPRPPEKPETAAHACILWADAARRAGFAAQTGFSYEPAAHCPETALEFLFLAQHRDPADARWLDSADRLTAQHKGLTFYRLGILARLALNQPDDWRRQSLYGLACLQCCRVDAGLHELTLAHALAVRQGRERDFFRLLDGIRPGGRLARAVRRLNVPEQPGDVKG